jgi:riboflavin biosynthesis pyrimidine reductase
MIYSADGAAAVAGRVQGLTCQADQTLLQHLRTLSDAVLVGAATARAEQYGPVRFSDEQQELRRINGFRHPARIAVVSRTGEIPESLHDQSASVPLLITTSEAANRHNLVTDETREVVIAGHTAVNIATAVDQLRRLGLQRVLCEGGPTLLDEIIRADAVDEICVTISPRLAGSQGVGASPALPLEIPIDMDLMHTVVHEGYVFLRYARAH